VGDEEGEEEVRTNRVPEAELRELRNENERLRVALEEIATGKRGWHNCCIIARQALEEVKR
jgi:hypothetical protein